MSHVRVSIVSVCLLILVSMAETAVSQQNTLVLDSQGRVLQPFVRGDKLQKVRVEVRDAARDKGVEQHKLHCRPLPSFDNTASPSDADQEYKPTPSGPNLVDLAFQLAPPSGSDFLFCSLLRQTNAPLSEQEARAFEKELEKAKAAVSAAQKALANTPEGKAHAVARAATVQTKGQQDKELAQRRAELKTATDPIEKQIAQYQSDITAFQQRETEGAVTEIKRLQTEIRTLRSQIATLDAGLTKMEQQFTAVLNGLIAAEEAASQKANMTTEAAALANAEVERESINVKLQPGTRRQFTVLHYSHLLVGRNDRPVYYRVLHRDKDNREVVALERAGNYPVFTTDSRIYAVVVNRQRKELPEPFRVTFTQTAGTPPDPAPVRPSFPASLQGGVLTDYTGYDEAYGDFVMSFGGPFKADTLLKVKISTVLAQRTEDSDKTTVTDAKTQRVQTTETKMQNAELLKDEEYPQVRGLYYFNFTSGVAISRLRDPSYVRRAVKLDDPATTDKNEAEYEDLLVRGDLSVKPMFAVSVYLTPIDIQKPLTWWDRIRPAVMLGFSFQSPQDNIYIGAAIEPVKSLQIMLGSHIGKITKKREPASVSDIKSATAPTSDQRFDNALFGGVSFNIGFIKTIFTGQ